MFDEIAMTVAQGLAELGRDVILVKCRALMDGCATVEALGGRQVTRCLSCLNSSASLLMSCDATCTGDHCGIQCASPLPHC